MWKPVQLQGAGAAVSIIDANPHPAGKMDPWRRQVVCLFGLTPTGTPNGGDTSCGAGWNFFTPTSSNPQVDRLPLEAVVGWTASLNGNLAELLQEPTLMGALEGAAITVLSKGANFPAGSDPFQTNNAVPGVFPTGTKLLSTADCTAVSSTGAPLFPSSFWCNPSSIDGLGITNSSQGGGGIFVHAWGHNLQIANDEIYNNAGTFGGGISVGQGEFAPSYIQGSALNAAPGSCQTSATPGVQLPYCQNMFVNMHHNYVALNSSTGDELFSATPAGTGGVSICTGADYYKFNYNWVCGNLSTGDGGGVGHLGFIYNGDIEHNTVVFNQSLNPTISANGGGILVMGTPDVDPPCGITTDADCVPPVGSVAPADGMGPNLVINANLIMGNAAESGSGGGLRFQAVNGTEVVAFPTTPSQWYHATVTNNIIADNVAGWDGAGISLLDALNVDIVNNTIVSNTSTASAGILFTTIAAPLASAQGTHCTNSSTTSCPQVAGLVSIQNSANFAANFPDTIVCPPGHFGAGGATNGTCRRYSYPLLANDVFWQNSTYYIGVGALSPQYQQNIVSLYKAFTTTLAANQLSTGACEPATSYWDIGARGDTGPTNHNSQITLRPMYSVLTSLAGGYNAGPLNNIGGPADNPNFVSQYCDGSRTPPEYGSAGWQVPPGIADATVPNPVFNLTPVATVDEGNNWINLRWGPLSLSNPLTGTTLGNYSLAFGSPAIDYIPNTSPTYALAPTTDFFGNPRPDVSGNIDIGAVESIAAITATPPTLTSITPTFGYRGDNVAAILTGTNLSGATVITGLGGGVAGAITSKSPTAVTANFTIAANATITTRNLGVTTPEGTSNTVPFAVMYPPTATLTSISPTSGFRGDNVVVTLTGTNFTIRGTSVAVSGGGVTVPASSISVDATGTQLTATFVISATAGLTNRNVTVTNTNQFGTASNAMTFSVVNPPTATLATISPTFGVRGNSVAVTLTGTNFTTRGTTVNAGTGITVSGVSVNAAGTVLTATFAISGTTTTAPGPRNVTVANANLTASNAVVFNLVNPPTATLATINPTSGVRGNSVGVTLTGTNFTTTGTTVAVASGGVTVSGISVNATGTVLTATFAISGTTAVVGPTNVTVTNPNGVASNGVPFTVNNPATATLTSINPTFATHPASGSTPVAVTLIGTNFTTTGTSVTGTVVGSGVSVSGISVNAAGTQLTATFTISSAATTGARTVTVTNPNGVASNALAFTVN